MTDNPDETLEQRKARRLAEIDSWIAEQKRKDKEREARHLEEVAGLLDQAVEREAKRVSDVATAALDELERRLRDLDLLSDDDYPTRLSVHAPATDEVFVGIEIDGLRYAFAGAGDGDILIVRRMVNGYREYATLDENSVPGPWFAPERDN